MVELDSSEAGHSIPTGAIELRMAWLDVRVRARHSEREWRLKATPEPVFNLEFQQDGLGVWDVAGMNTNDAALFGNEVVEGSRVYRAIVVDRNGRQTLNYWEARNKVFDNRLQAGEARIEMYRFTLPEDLAEDLVAVATLHYLRYPPGFAARLGIVPAPSVLVSKAHTEISVSR